SRVCPVADRYWNARGGSHTDGGAFLFSVDYTNGRLSYTNKFGEPVAMPSDSRTQPPKTAIKIQDSTLEELSTLHDLPGTSNGTPRKWHLAAVNRAIDDWLDHANWPRADWKRRDKIPAPKSGSKLIINATGFAAEGPDSLSLFVARAYELGWRDIVVYRCKGHRFLACGLHEKTDGLRLHIYGSSGDYLASGLDGAEVYVHGNGQDQLGQIFHRGKLVVYGDVGQTFFYGAKGGEAFIMGNAAGRPLINAVGCPRVVINGTCLDYLGESFMAGNPLQGGGFVILNGITRDEKGKVNDLPSPYPGSNLFSLASGGAIYVRDPGGVLSPDQLNGGEFAEVGDADWALISPYLAENERLFHISAERDLLEGQPPSRVYRKIQPIQNEALH
ncbi:MAG TPA: hypothetical protein VFG11_01565, partial [Acidobacteriota bacterium]|nr:hypothetical protein [Acidobacteriota bacterium]